MAQAKWLDEPTDDDGPLVQRRAISADADADMTPMIDMTFLLLIFFLVTQAAAQMSPVELPPAKHGKGVSETNSTVLVLAHDANGGAARVYRGDSLDEPLPVEQAAQEEGVRAYVEAGMAQDRTDVIIKADRLVRYRDVSRIAAAAGRVEGVKINLAVLEEE